MGKCLPGASRKVAPPFEGKCRPPLNFTEVKFRDILLTGGTPEQTFKSGCGPVYFNKDMQTY